VEAACIFVFGGGRVAEKYRGGESMLVGGAEGSGIRGGRKLSLPFRWDSEREFA